MEDPENEPLNRGHVIEMQPKFVDLRKQLIGAFRRDDFKEFSRLSIDQDPNIFHQKCENGMSCFNIVCSESSGDAYIQLIAKITLDNQMVAILNEENEKSGLTPLQLTLKLKNYDGFRTLCWKTGIDSKNKSGCMRIIIENARSVDVRDERAVKEYKRLMQYLYEYKFHRIPLEDWEGLIDYASENSLNFVLESFSEYLINLHLKVNIDHIVEKLPKNIFQLIKLFDYLKNRDEKSFGSELKNLESNCDLNRFYFLCLKNKYYTLLQFACEEGLSDAVRALLKTKIDKNKITKLNQRPICVACEHGHYEILELLLNDLDVSVDRADFSNRSLFEFVMLKPQIDRIDDHRKCIEMLLNDERTSHTLNTQNDEGLTPLHIAAINGHENFVLFFLKNEASINSKFVSSSKCPLHDMSPKTLEVHLDECLYSNGVQSHLKEYNIMFNYNFLKPLKHSEDVLFTWPAPEMEPLLQMTQISGLKHLIKHPVITSFVYLKWQRIKFLYYVNIVLYTIFWASLILFTALDRNHTKNKYDVYFVSSVMSFLSIIIIRETIQFWKYTKRYVKSFENWLEIVLILITAWILVCKLLIVLEKIEENLQLNAARQQLSSIAILLATTEFIMLVGKLPILSTYFTMLYTVSQNVFKFTWLFSALFIGFASIFHILFRSEKTEEMFANFWLSIFKTFIMFTGEFDAGSINFDSYPITSQLMFTLFVFLVTIVLFNLLNGLAISDIQSVKDDAEIIGYKARIELLSILEGIFFGQSAQSENFDFSCVSIPYSPMSFSQNNERKPKQSDKSPDFAWLAKQISIFPLFYICSCNNVKVLTNINNKTLLENGKFPPKVIYMDKAIMKAAQMKINGKFEVDRKKRIKETEEADKYTLKQLNEMRLNDIKHKLQNIETDKIEQSKRITEIQNKMSCIENSIFELNSSIKENGDKLEKILESILTSKRK